MTASVFFSRTKYFRRFRTTRCCRRCLICRRRIRSPRLGRIGSSSIRRRIRVHRSRFGYSIRRRWRCDHGKDDYRYYATAVLARISLSRRIARRTSNRVSFDTETRFASHDLSVIFRTIYHRSARLGDVYPPRVHVQCTIRRYSRGRFELVTLHYDTTSHGRKIL